MWGGFLTFKLDGGCNQKSPETLVTQVTAQWNASQASVVRTSILGVGGMGRTHLLLTRKGLTVAVRPQRSLSVSFLSPRGLGIVLFSCSCLYPPYRVSNSSAWERSRKFCTSDLGIWEWVGRGEEWGPCEPSYGSSTGKSLCRAFSPHSLAPWHIFKCWSVEV